MLWTILKVPLVLRLAGLTGRLGGGFLPLLLVAAAIGPIVNFVTGRRKV